MTSCDNTEDFVQTPTAAQVQTTKLTDAEALKVGWHLIQLSYYCADLHISEEICDRLEADNNDLSAVIDAINYLSLQDVFGDTLAETDEWEVWCKYINSRQTTL